MLIVNFSGKDFEDFSERGAKNTLRKTIVSEGDGSRMCRLRYYSIQPGGQTPYDIHDYEHIVIVVGGRGTILSKEGGMPVMHQIRSNDVVYIRSGEPHQFINTGEKPLEFLCFSTSQHLYSQEVLAAVEKLHGQ